MIEKDFDIPFIADLALREKQIQQNYRPVIAVHKWFARRPGTLFRGLLLSEFGSRPLREAYYQSHALSNIKIADPFMGGGIPVIEANRIGCDVVGYDINPMSYWIVQREIEQIDLDLYRKTAEGLRGTLEKEIGSFYRTKCTICGAPEARVKYFLWVKTKSCFNCGREIDLFPGFLLAQNRRHPKNVFICPECGELTETESSENPGKCSACKYTLSTSGPAKRGHVLCPHCKKTNKYLAPESGPPEHRLFAIEYHCPHCKPGHKGRFFKVPDTHDLAHLQEVECRWKSMKPRCIPDDPIPEGDESSRLHRWGYRKYREMFNTRQLLGLEISCRLIEKVPDKRIREALATNLSDLLRYQNMLCRYDKMALKSLDIFSVHGFPVGLIQCESNFMGIEGRGLSMAVGSGGWLNIIEKYIKAKEFCSNPFEIDSQGKHKKIIPIPGERIGDSVRKNNRANGRSIKLFCSDATDTDLPPETLDGVFTDPPYFGNVQYAELMDFCYVWLRKLTGQKEACFKAPSTRNRNELTGNENMSRGLIDFTEGLSAVFQKMSLALKKGSPLAFTYHHNDLTAYYPVASAILDARLTCSASLPCPAEMGASIHITGTGSSIIDTIFICRFTGKVPRRWVPEKAEGLAQIISEDLEKLASGNIKLTRGDIRCIIYGHLIRLAVWNLRNNWDKDSPTSKKMTAIDGWIKDIGGLSAIEKYLDPSEIPSRRTMMIKEPESEYTEAQTEISF